MKYLPSTLGGAGALLLLSALAIDDESLGGTEGCPGGAGAACAGAGGNESG